MRVEPEAPESAVGQNVSMLYNMQERTEVSDEENQHLLISECAQQLMEEIYGIPFHKVLTVNIETVNPLYVA